MLEADPNLGKRQFAFEKNTCYHKSYEEKEAGTVPILLIRFLTKKWKFNSQHL